MRDENIEYSKSPDVDETSNAMAVQVFDAARAIPAGRVLAYGELGARCEPAISGYICGRIMNNVADDVPWWRVVAKDGSLPIAKRNPTLAERQRDLLSAEGVEFDESGHVKMDEFRAA